jgi:hypothetical protein
VIVVTVLGAVLATVGVIVGVWGAIGRYLDRHSWSEDDGTAMAVGAAFFAAGIFLLVTSA